MVRMRRHRRLVFAALAASALAALTGVSAAAASAQAEVADAGVVAASGLRPADEDDVTFDSLDAPASYAAVLLVLVAGPAGLA